MLRLKNMKSLKKLIYNFSDFFKNSENSKRRISVFLQLLYTVWEVSVWSCVPLWGLAHTLLSFGRLRAKVDSPPHNSSHILHLIKPLQIITIFSTTLWKTQSYQSADISNYTYFFLNFKWLQHLSPEVWIRNYLLILIYLLTC